VIVPLLGYLAVLPLFPGGVSSVGTHAFFFTRPALSLRSAPFCSLFFELVLPLFVFLGSWCRATVLYFQLLFSPLFFFLFSPLPSFLSSLPFLFFSIFFEGMSGCVFPLSDCLPRSVCAVSFFTCPFFDIARPLSYRRALRSRAMPFMLSSHCRPTPAWCSSPPLPWPSRVDFRAGLDAGHPFKAAPDLLAPPPQVRDHFLPRFAPCFVLSFLYLCASLSPPRGWESQSIFMPFSFFPLRKPFFFFAPQIPVNFVFSGRPPPTPQAFCF